MYYHIIVNNCCGNKTTIETLCVLSCRLSDCKLRSKSCEALASVLKSANSLTELDLSNNVLKDSGIQHLSVGLSSTESQVQKLRSVLHYITYMLQNIYY